MASKTGTYQREGLWVLHGNGMVEGISNLSLDFYFCEHFLYGKHHQVRFSFSATREKETLQLVHNFLFGSMIIQSPGNFVCYVSFVVVWSRNIWIYFLGKKLEVFEKIKEKQRDYISTMTSSIVRGLIAMRINYSTYILKMKKIEK